MRFEPFITIGCTHGVFLDRKFEKVLKKVVEDFKPKHRHHLGDYVDMTALRRGASSSDVTWSPDADVKAAEGLFDWYRPTVVAEGNHDWRPRQHINNPNKLISEPAQRLHNNLLSIVHAHTPHYILRDSLHGYWQFGDTRLVHGFGHGKDALQTHTKFFQGPVQMAHVHYTAEAPVEGVGGGKSFVVGCGLDFEAAKYADEWLAKLRWRLGFLMGFLDTKKNKTHSWLVSCNDGIWTVPKDFTIFK